MSQAKWILIIVVVVIVGGIAYYAISPLFNNIEVQDELPENIVDGNLSEEEQVEMERQIEEANAEGPIEMDEEMPQSASPAPTTSATFTIMGTAGHPASGIVRVIQTTSGQIIRYENFETINGPDLHVYLAKDFDAHEYIDLGPIKGTSGSINYEVPAGTNLSEYRYVMYWCVPFGVLFNYAELP